MYTHIYIFIYVYMYWVTLVYIYIYIYYNVGKELPIKELPAQPRSTPPKVKEIGPWAGKPSKS